ncbi:MAG: trigger factor [Firmicutes bacterium]|nr:trigger factor [Bacillota bacterium]MEE3383379.1 trigger factor [Anaerovoracaceae bacterium]
MKTNFISREDNKVKFSMEFSAEEFENAQIEAYKKNKDQFTIDGFRKGKAPRTIIERHYGEGVFFEDALDELFRENYVKALDELDLEVIDSPAAEFTQLKKGEGFTATITVPVFPEIEVKDYKGVEVEKKEGKVDEKDVDQDIENIRKRNARMVSVDRKAETGDTVYFDYAGFVGDEQFQGGTAEKQTLKLGSGMFIPGFEEELVGVKADEDRDVHVTFPEDYQAENLAGKDAVFHCHIHEVREEQLPDVDDDLAKDATEYETLEELKEATRKRLQEAAEKNAENQMKDEAAEKVMAANEFEIPAVMVNDELDRSINDFAQQMAYSGLNLDMYFKYTNSNMEQLRDQIRPDAEKSVKLRIILQNIARLEGLQCTEEDLNSELEFMAKQYNTDPAEVRKMLGEDSIVYFKKDIQAKKAMDLIYSEAKKVEKAAEAKEEDK